MSTGPQSSLTILFEAPFWIGLYERTDNGKYEVCKITFGSEPKDYEVYQFLLKLNHGDLKATQGDTGHAQIDMITSVYAHILDEDRKINAQKFESAFYANPNLRAVRPPEEPKEPAPTALDLEALVEQLRQ